MNRRTWLGSLAASAATLAMVRLGQSSSRVPRRLDCEKNHDEQTTPVDIFRYGVPQHGCVAYDLDAQWVRVYKKTPSGNPYIIGNTFATETLHGGIVERWMKNA
jgi:hypothetical protein